MEGMLVAIGVGSSMEGRIMVADCRNGGGKPFGT
jgi:hypothetical protein